MSKSEPVPVVEKNPELEALGAEAAAVDAANAPPVAVTVEGAAVPGEPVPVAVDRMGEAGVLLGIAKPLLVLLVPYIADAPEPEWAALQEPIAGLLEHYQVDVGAWLNSPWAKLGAAAIPLAMRGVMGWNAEQKTKPAPGIGAEPEKILEAVAGEAGAEPVFAARG